MPYSRGDVVLVLWPNTDQRTFSKRPALIVQADGVVTDLPNRLIACITTTQRTGRSRVSVSKDSLDGISMGLIHDSVIVLDDLTSIGEDTFEKRIGSCSVMPQVDDALRAALAL